MSEPWLPGDIPSATFEFAGELWEWRGPSPYHFITVPPDVAEAIREVANLLTYGWGVIPVTIRIGASGWRTSLFPKDGGYVVPIKDKIRKGEGLVIGDMVDVELDVGS